MDISKVNENISDNSQVRFDAILKRIPSDAEKILNVGVAANIGNRGKKGWLHGYLIEHTNAEVAGVAIEEGELGKLEDIGHDISYMDGQYIDLDDTFDVIIVGQVFYNFYDYGEFFRRSADHLNKDGKIVYSSRNPHSFVEFRKAWTGDVPSRTQLSPENIQRMLSLLNEGLELTEFELLPGMAGGVSDVLWKLGLKRIGSSQYVGTIEPI